MTLVVTLRKFLSLLFSIWYFQVKMTPDDIRFLPSFFYRPESGFTDTVSYFEQPLAGYRIYVDSEGVKSSHFCIGLNNF